MAATERLTSVAVVIDCVDPERVARFWRDLFGWTELWRRGPYIGLLAGKPLEGVTWILQRVPEPRTGKNRCHPDFSIDGDLEAVMRRVIELGGSRVAGYGPGGFLVMADPEGNEFCLVPHGFFPMDEDGNARYLSGPLAHLARD